MAIQTIEKMVASPSRFDLPQRIEVDTILSSTETSERCRFVYSLPEDNDIVFEDGTKRDERVEKVARAATPISHRLKLRQRDAGTHPASLQLTQDLFDEVGLRTRTRINLSIDRSQP
jgi:hypothetical protein